jgi:cytoskeleton protein RodZ
MITTDERNSNNDQSPVNIQSTDINLNIAAEDRVRQTDYENIEIVEKDTLESLVGEQQTDFESSSANSNTHKSESIEITNDQDNMYNRYEHNPITPNELKDIDSVSVVQSVGHLLRKARTARNMSVEDVSRQLRLSVHQIEAIEKEDFEKIPGRTFLRGFVRNYANLVQLDPVPLLQLLPESTQVISTYERTPFTNKQISFSTNRENPSNHSLTIVIILLVIILGTYFIFGDVSWNKNSVTSFSNEEAKYESGTTSVEIQLPLSAKANGIDTAQTNKATETTHSINNLEKPGVEPDTKAETIRMENKLTSPETENTDAISGDSGHLNFKFTADSWVKVIDGKGTPLFEQLKKGGSEQIITGKRPLSVVIGNASGVNLTYNDKEIDISSYKKQDGTARFTLK